MDSLASLTLMKQLVFRLEVLPVRKWEHHLASAISPTYEKLLTYVRSSCRIGLATTSLEGIHGSVLFEMPDQEGDEQRPGYHDEEWPPGHPGCMPGLLNQDVPDWQGCIARLCPETAAEPTPDRLVAAATYSFIRTPISSGVSIA